MATLERTHLIILREVQRCGSVTRAARSLGLTQSALSHAIKKLESEVGAPVWARNGRQLSLTQPGQYLLSVAERLLPQLEHAEQVLGQFARGERGSLRIGIECHPCYQWLLKVVAPYLRAFPDVDVDVKQKFQFGGVGALYNHEIDVLVTPDPLRSRGLVFEPVFDYEHVLVVSCEHPLAARRWVRPSDLEKETLLTYPVEIERLDIYSQFLIPAQCRPRQRKVIETTDILLQMVESNRGVTALPGWLVGEYSSKLDIRALSLGRQGLPKQLHLGLRRADKDIAYLAQFCCLARETSSALPGGRP